MSRARSIIKVVIYGRQFLQCHFKLRHMNKYLEQRGEMVFVWGWTSSWSWVFEVEINSIEATGSRESDGGIDERRSVGGCWQHDYRLLHSEIPSSNGYRHLNSRLLGFQCKCLLIPKSIFDYFVTSNRCFAFCISSIPIRVFILS